MSTLPSRLSWTRSSARRTKSKPQGEISVSIRFAKSSGSPSIRRIFCRAVSPDASVIADFGHFKLLLSRAISALLALPFSGTARHACPQMGIAVCGDFDALKTIAPAIRGEPDGEQHMIFGRAIGSGHNTSGARLVHNSERRKKMIKSTTIGEMSMPPRSGMKRRIGRRTGSVTL